MTDDELRAIAHEEAYADACEDVGPNSPEFEALVEDYAEKAYDSMSASFIELGYYLDSLNDTWYQIKDTHIESIEVP